MDMKIASSPLKNSILPSSFRETPGSKGVSRHQPKAFQRAVSFFLLCGCLLAPLLTAADAPANKPGEYRVLKKIPLSGNGSWDYLTVDPAARKLYIANSDRVLVLDLDTEKEAGEITGLDGVHGVALVPEFNRAFVSSGRDSTVRVVDLKTLKESARLKAGPRPDAIIYEPVTKRVFAFNNSGTTATAIDAEKASIDGEVELGGAPEFAVADGTGKVFVNLEDKSEIVSFDAKTLKAAAHWPLAPGASPTGLALDAAHHRLFSGCRESKTLVVMDAESGKIIASLPIGAGVDVVAFDADSQNAFSSNGDGTVTVVHEDDPATFKVVQTVETQAGARTCALDPKTHQLWLVTAETKTAADGAAPQDRPKRTVAPGTFTAIVVGK